MSERLMRLVTAGGVAVFLACALPAVAGATDYCVDPVTSCATGNNYQHLEDALAKADDATDADRVLLGTGPYTAPSVNGFVYQASDSPVEIVGAGAGRTILTGPAGAETILDLSGGSASSVSDLTVHGPHDAAFGYTGVWLDGTAKRIEVTEDSAQTTNFHKGLYLQHGGTLEDSRVMLDGILGATGVFLDDGHVLRSELRAEIGATTNNGSIEHSRVVGFYTGVKAYGGLTSVAASQIYAGEDYGIWAASYAGVSQTTVTANSVTIVGEGGIGKGAYASTDYDTGWSAGINLTNSVIRGFATALAASAPGTGLAQVDASYSDYDPSGNSTAGGANASISEANVSNVGDAGFTDAANGDYHLLPGSPLVDAGDPASAQGLDLDGNPLVADGNGDGSARRDIGAFEYPAAPVGAPAGPAAPDTKAPVITGFRTTPSLFTIARGSTPLAARMPRGTRFRYTLSEKARVTLRIQRRLAGRRARYRTAGVLSRSASSGPNRTRFSGRLRKRALRPGRYRVRIIATDTAGNRSAPRTTRFRIARS